MCDDWLILLNIPNYTSSFDSFFLWSCAVTLYLAILHTYRRTGDTLPQDLANGRALPRRVTSGDCVRKAGNTSRARCFGQMCPPKIHQERHLDIKYHHTRVFYHQSQYVQNSREIESIAPSWQARVSLCNASSRIHTGNVVILHL